MIEWLTGYTIKRQEEFIEEKVNFEVFFKNASLNPKAGLIKGVICGCRVEEIENQLTQQVRYLDKLVDELAKGRKMEKIEFLKIRHSIIDRKVNDFLLHRRNI